MTLLHASSSTITEPRESKRERCTEKRFSEMPSVEELQKEAADIQKRYDECQKCRGGAFD